MRACSCAARASCVSRRARGSSCPRSITSATSAATASSDRFPAPQLAITSSICDKVSRRVTQRSASIMRRNASRRVTSRARSRAAAAMRLRLSSAVARTAETAERSCCSGRRRAALRRSVTSLSAGDSRTNSPKLSFTSRTFVWGGRGVINMGQRCNVTAGVAEQHRRPFLRHTPAVRVASTGRRRATALPRVHVCGDCEARR